MDYLQKVLAEISVKVDNFPVGAANVHDSVSLEFEINTIQSKVQCTKADVLILQALTEIAKNSNANRGKTDLTHIAKYENALVDDASAINHPRNMAVLAEEAAALQEALEMQPEEMEHQPLSCRSLLESCCRWLVYAPQPSSVSNRKEEETRIKNIVPKCSSTQLELLEIQNDINQKLKEIEEMECTLMKKKAKYASDLVKQKKHLDKKRSSKDEGYDRKSKNLKNIASEINMMKTIIQALIFLSPESLEEKKVLEILEFTRKPLNLVTYSTQI
ncbi:uncharacterized protein LOC124612910 isoform X1 [Schistocerca americana]|uniref:uncharacterized protein LOC124612910 isoform X1 n=1 Tax=Schistocerca americana TaxID=7009 RepID=UPI001F4FC7FF|nr:uncharacterized protein LOC124612910 isoform X1 [Schistocerca americana]XP_046997353.1 uncharacterized protein LOC124612910 isoform X1 [Schistocerca americana]